MITSIYRAIPPVENNIINEIEVTVHTYRTVTADVGSEKVTAKHTIVPSDSSTKSMIIRIQCL